MRLQIIYSEQYLSGKVDPFSIAFHGDYAERFIRHLSLDPTLCIGCGHLCEYCRETYPIEFSGLVVGVSVLPCVLPYYLDDPEKLLANSLVPHDMTIAINVHEEILIYLPSRIRDLGSHGLIVPSEDPDWVTPWIRSEVTRRCRSIGLESAFPKPFCSLEEGAGPHIDRFMEEFRLGKPEIEIEVRDGMIREARVLRSAPCGATYYVAWNLKGTFIDADIDEVVTKYWHSYPCVASMKMDRELGDTILHKGGYNHLEAAHRAVAAYREREASKGVNS